MELLHELESRTLRRFDHHQLTKRACELPRAWPALWVMFGDTGQFQPGMHRVFVNAGCRRWKIRIRETAGGNHVGAWNQVQVPENVAAATGTEAKSDGQPAVRSTLVDLILAFTLHLLLLPEAAEMKGGARTDAGRPGSGTETRVPVLP